jgi:exopolysaccharide biosynthesis protein
VTTALDGLVPLILTTASGRQRFSNADPWYSRLNTRGAIGHSVVGHNPDAHRVFVIVQDHAGAAFALDALRDLADRLGCHHAVAFDGSDSAFLTIEGHTRVRNEDYKDRLNPNAVAFYRV